MFYSGKKSQIIYVLAKTQNSGQSYLTTNNNVDWMYCCNNKTPLAIKINNVWAGAKKYHDPCATYVTRCVPINVLSD